MLKNSLKKIFNRITVVKTWKSTEIFRKYFQDPGFHAIAITFHSAKNMLKYF